MVAPAHSAETTTTPSCSVGFPILYCRSPLWISFGRFGGERSAARELQVEILRLHVVSVTKKKDQIWVYKGTDSQNMLRSLSCFTSEIKLSVETIGKRLIELIINNWMMSQNFQFPARTN